MPESPPTDVAADTPVHGAEALTPEAIEAVLSDFRAWLRQSAEPGPPLAETNEPIDLHTLLGQFIALRHEVHLQTRASRAQQEQTGEALTQLGQALETLRLAATRSGPDGDEPLRPLVKTMLDVRDALGLASREVQRVQEVVLPALDRITAAFEEPSSIDDVPPARPSFWQRWRGRPPQPLAASPRLIPAPRERQEQAQQATARVRNWVESLVTGYTMSLQRLDRTLGQLGLEPIPSQGFLFDPETMEAVDAVTGTGLPAGQVVEEVRPGYRWRDRVFRYAQVRVARS